MLNLNEEELLKIYLDFESRLYSPENWKKVKLTAKWLDNFEAKGGVYLFKEKGIICYVGESRQIKKRMSNLFQTQQHVLRQKIGNTHFKSHPDYTTGTSRVKFRPSIEAELNEWINNNLEVSVVYINIGRIEFEHYLDNKYGYCYNHKKKKK